MDRRQFVSAVGISIMPFSAGCISEFDSAPSVEKISIELDNRGSEEQIFHFAIETKSEILDWHSVTVSDGGTETVELHSSIDSLPIAIHGVVDDYAKRNTFRGIENAPDEFCMDLAFIYLNNEEVEILERAGLKC